MKKAQLLFVVLMVFVSISLTACNKDKQNNGNSASDSQNGDISQPGDNINPDEDKAETKVYSEGLEFTSNGDGTCYVSGIGTCIDTDLKIPPTSPEGDSVVSIGNSAGVGPFSYCDSINNVVIPDSVTSIGPGAFLGCTLLTSIEIPDSVTSIGPSAFRDTGYYNNESNWKNEVLYMNNYLLEAQNTISGEYIIQDGTKVIADSAFQYSQSLTNITIPDSVTSIGDYAFSGCDSLTSIEIPDSVTSIGPGAFLGCKSLTNVTIPDSVTSIGSNAFSGTGYYKDKGNWENGVLYIRDYLIEAKDTISGEYIIKEGTTVIADSAFWGCTSLTSVTIPDSVTSIGDRVFCACENLTVIAVSEDNVSYKSIDGNLYSKDESKLIQYAVGKTDQSFTTLAGVRSIGNYAFADCDSLTSVTISNSVTSIGDYAFNACTSLASVAIGTGVTKIGYDAFAYCENLANVHIMDIASWCNISFNSSEYSNPLSYTKKLYLNGNLITELVIPDGVTSIGNYAFADCNCLTSITIPDSVTSIGYDAFDFGTIFLDGVYISNIERWCNISFCNDDSNPLRYSGKLYLNGKLVTEVVVPDGITSIGNYVFNRCYGLTSIKIPDSVTSIGDYAFTYCESLTNVTIPDSVTSIGYSAFSNCTSLTSVTIPNSVTSIGVFAFCDCTSLTSITIPDSITSIGSNAFYNTGYYNNESNWKNEVLYISNYLLVARNTIYGEYIIQDGTKVVAASAFRQCANLTGIIIPDTITSIGDRAFIHCTDIYYTGTEEEWAKVTIGSSNEPLLNATIHYNYVPEE